MWEKMKNRETQWKYKLNQGVEAFPSCHDVFGVFYIFSGSTGIMNGKKKKTPLNFNVTSNKSQIQTGKWFWFLSKLDGPLSLSSYPTAEIRSDQIFIAFTQHEYDEDNDDLNYFSSLISQENGEYE